MERPENMKRRSREKDRHKKPRKKNHNVPKIRHHDHHQLHKLEKNKDRKKDKINYHHRIQEEERVNDFAASSSSSSSTSDVGNGELGIFDFPWLKDENSMFRGDDVEQLCRSSLEDMIYQQQMSYAAHNTYYRYFDDLLDCNIYAKTWTEINQHEKYYGDKNCDGMSEFDSDKIELGCRMEYYIWMSVLDQPLN